MLISKDKDSLWSIHLEENKLALYNNGCLQIERIKISDLDATVLREKKANKEASLECEYKFLVNDNTWQDSVEKKESYKQLYLTKDVNKWQSRLRIVDEEKAFLTIKGPRVGIANIEVEYPIDIKDAFKLWGIHEGVRLSKERSIVTIDNEKWEIDVFTDKELKGLQLVEIEVPNENSSISFTPSWVGVDVTDNPHFRNDSLANYIFDKKANKETYDIFEEIQKITPKHIKRKI